MLVLRSFISGRWIEGSGATQTLVNPATEAPLATASSEGVDLSAALGYARNTGGPALRALGFAERGALLQGMADALHGTIGRALQSQPGRLVSVQGDCSCQ